MFYLNKHPIRYPMPPLAIRIITPPAAIMLPYNAMIYFPPFRNEFKLKKNTYNFSNLIYAVEL